MALRSPSRTPPRDSPPPADSPQPTSQGGSSSGARAVVARKTKEAERLLAKLEKEGVEVDGKLASVIDNEMARIKAEAARENVNDEPEKKNWRPLLFTFAAIAVGFIMGVEWYEHAFLAANAKKRRDSNEELSKRRRA